MSAPAELLAAWQAFVGAVESGDAQAVGACLSGEVTMYLPFANSKDAVSGRAAVIALFTRVFANMRGQRGPVLSVERLDCRELSPSVYLLESMLKFGNEWGRRSVVYRLEDGAWRILHMHGSNVVEIQSKLPFALG